jgi:guanylate kinase
MILSGPSGSGKDAVLGELTKLDDRVQLSVSMTTRPKRDWEIGGVHYHFVSRPVFEEKIAAGDMLEHTSYSGNYYGTPKAPVDSWLARGRTVILKIEVEGAERVQRLYPQSVRVFLMPPSLRVLEERLRRRESEAHEEACRRLEIAKNEISRANAYDYIVVNDRLEYAVSDLREILSAERQRACRRAHLVEQVLCGGEWRSKL